MDIRHIMAQLGIPPMKFAIYTLQSQMADYKALSRYKRAIISVIAKPVHHFMTRDLPIIVDEMIKEEKRNEHTPFD